MPRTFFPLFPVVFGVTCLSTGICHCQKKNSLTTMTVFQEVIALALFYLLAMTFFTAASLR